MDEVKTPQQKGHCFYVPLIIIFFLQIHLGSLYNGLIGDWKTWKCLLEQKTVFVTFLRKTFYNFCTIRNKHPIVNYFM